MYRPRFAITSVGSDADRRVAAADLFDLCEALVRIDQRILQRKRIPPLMSAGIFYRDDSARVCDRQGCRIVEDDWADLEAVIGQGYGDCDDLAAWRVAELRAAGRQAYPLARCFDCGPRVCVRCAQPSGSTTWHMQVLHGDGAIEDICRRLGMSPHPEGDAAVIPPELMFRGGF